MIMMIETIIIAVAMINISFQPSDFSTESTIASDFIVSNISFTAAWKEFILLSLLQEKYGRVLALFIGAHVGEKKLLMKLDFLLKSETKLHSANNDGIVRTILLQSN